MLSLARTTNSSCCIRSPGPAAGRHCGMDGSVASVLRQKLAVTEIPVATITATFKKHTFSYWTYGVDNKVFETEYPGKPNCSVM